MATRPIDDQVDLDSGYRLLKREPHFKDPDTLIVLAFSGGGTRAAAFSYGVLEYLRRTEIVNASGERVRLLDSVAVITGVSGGSFTALAYGLYGEKLFSEYEQRFLKRDVQGEITARFLNPAYWGDLWSSNWGRSEMAADLYDEILFNGATYADFRKGSRAPISWRRRPTFRPGPGSFSTRTSSMRCARTSIRFGCRARPRRPRRFRWSCRR